MSPEQYADVVTRYGGHRHRALTRDRFGNRLPLDPSSPGDRGRCYTLCRATSAWTLESWRAAPDHPSLTVAQMADLPRCDVCLGLAPLQAGEVTDGPLDALGLRDLLRSADPVEVAYRPHAGAPWERGVVVAMTPGGLAFVRYGTDEGAKATPPSLLRLVL